jgi:hypothetical protein
VRAGARQAGVRSAARFALLLGLVSTVSSHAADPRCEVNVNVSLTGAGRKLPPPTKEKPAFYFPLLAGYREEGSLVAGEKKPPPVLVAHVLAKALAAQGYLVVAKDTPPPSLLLVVFWGYMNPQIDEFGDAENPQTVFFNQKEMLALVGGQTLGNLDLSFEREAVMQGAEDDRYFVIVSAYDFADARKKKKTLLWTARMSTPSAGMTLAEVLPALINSGGPLFGRETTVPKWVSAPLAPEGKVEIGTPTVVPEKPAAPSPAGTPSSEKK